ncbi:MAG TPA: HIT domain-containing protein [Nevskiaceae bacterium]|nr:HIT domain-containing protein [Nevskiaceae bacterium]
MNDCVFCKIAAKEKKEDILYEDEDIVVFADNNPRAKTHLLITPKTHYSDFSEMMEKEPTLLQKIGNVVEKVIKTSSIKGKGYTWGFHCGGKQSVNHIHAQLLAGMKEDELVL